MVLLLCAFGSFFVVRALRDTTVSGLNWAAWMKIGVCFAASLGISASFYYRHPRELVIYGLAGAGLAILIHRAARFLSAAGDRQIMSVMENRRRP